MQEFLVLLTAYYHCDAMAEVRHLTMQEVLGCSTTYEVVKTYFVTDFELAPRGTPERIAQMAAAAVAFQDWETANADLVADMQAGAWLAARGLSPAGG